MKRTATFVLWSSLNESTVCNRALLAVQYVSVQSVQSRRLAAESTKGLRSWYTGAGLRGVGMKVVFGS